MAKKNAVLILIIFAVTFSYLNLSAKTARKILGTFQSAGSSEHAPVTTPVYFADNRPAEEPLAHRLLAQVFPQTFGGQTQSQHLPQSQTQTQKQTQSQTQTQTQQTQTLYIGFPLQVSWRYKTNAPLIAQPQTDATSVFIAAKSGIVHRVTQTQGTVMWKVNVGDAIEDAFWYDQGILYVGTQNGLMLALQSTTGKEIWLQHLSDESFLTTPALDKTSIYYTGLHGTVVCLNRADGQILWKFKTSGACHVSPYILDNTLYVASDDRYLYALDKTAGFVR
ncbi:MAG TPA: PQQ-binding-like beta-propeller repeat protein, partial [Acidobacteriota bacterium]|nr:PQQ-binding-like beta-propeller repeat protein [Acidobacteriota bacterium]